MRCIAIAATNAANALKIAEVVVEGLGALPPVHISALAS
jgi:hypothetical protein